MLKEHISSFQDKKIQKEEFTFKRNENGRSHTYSSTLSSSHSLTWCQRAQQPNRRSKPSAKRTNNTIENDDDFEWLSIDC